MVHGIPGKRKLQEGDVVSVDCGTIFEGFVGDSAFTTGVGEVSPVAKRLMEVTEKALYIGIDKLRPGNHIGDVGAAIQQYVEDQGFYLTREYTGHGVGRLCGKAPRCPTMVLPVGAGLPAGNGDRPGAHGVGGHGANARDARPVDRGLGGWIADRSF